MAWVVRFSDDGEVFGRPDVASFRLGEVARQVYGWSRAMAGGVRSIVKLSVAASVETGSRRPARRL